MKYLLLAAALIYSGVALAQQVTSDKVVQRLDSVALVESRPKKHQIPLVGSASLMYNSGYIIAQPAFLYNKLSDVKPGYYAHRLRPGDKVFEAYYTPNSPWLRVSRETYTKGSTCHCDTAIYYMHKSAIQPRPGVPPHIFSFH